MSPYRIAVLFGGCSPTTKMQTMTISVLLSTCFHVGQTTFFDSLTSSRNHFLIHLPARTKMLAFFCFF